MKTFNEQAQIVFAQVTQQIALHGIVIEDSHDFASLDYATVQAVGHYVVEDLVQFQQFILDHPLDFAVSEWTLLDCKSAFLKLQGHLIDYGIDGQLASHMTEMGLKLAKLETMIS